MASCAAASTPRHHDSTFPIFAGSVGSPNRSNTGGGRRRHFAATNDLLTLDFVRALHKCVFGETWRWAGTFRATEKHIGVDPARIASILADVCADVKTQLEHASYPLDEIAVRLSHRLVSIHPFANGNGRLSRTFADLILVENGAARFSWGAANLVSGSQTRASYLAALRAADAKNYTLINFKLNARSASHTSATSIVRKEPPINKPLR